MAKEKAPAFQFYVKEFITDANQAGMSLQEVGAYARLMCFEWNEHGKGIPDDAVRCGRMVGASPGAMRKMWATLRSCFRPHAVDAGRLVHPRLELERAKQAAYRRRQSDAAASRWHSDGTPPAHAGSMPDACSPTSDLRSPKERDKSASLSPAAPQTVHGGHGPNGHGDPRRDPFTDPEVTKRAGRFVERYQALYPQHRHGARYALKPSRDYAAAVTLCETWPDDARLEKLAICFLTTDHKFAAEGSRTIPQFLALASWVDGQLGAWEAKQGKPDKER